MSGYDKPIAGIWSCAKQLLICWRGGPKIRCEKKMVAPGAGLARPIDQGPQTVALQPLSVQGQIGLDIAAGVGSLDLHPSW
jgi:hypothetical protein